MFYPDEVIEDLRERADIVDVVGAYVPLKKKGATYFGLCPFHGEKTPSFSVSPGKRMFYCFGCGKGGDVFRFLMEYENLGFQESVQALARQLGYALPEPKEEDPTKRKERDIRTQLLEANKCAALYYHHLLRSPEGALGIRYFQERALEARTIRHFGLGYTGQDSKGLYRHLRENGFSDALLRESGLFSFSERGVYDKFFNRVMFPILDQNSRVIGFGGRVMGQGEPKYLNSPETKLFDKSRNLFALNFARKSRQGYFVLCEGYMDVISMHQAGFDNAVASLGTSFTEEQARLLKRFTSEVILSYDSDGAGVKAARRAIPMLRNVGITPRILVLSPYKDPDEFMKALGKEAFQERLQNARNAFLWEAEVLKQSYDLQDPAGQTAYDEALALLLLERFPEGMERENYIKAVSREQMLDAEGLRRLVAKKAERGNVFSGEKRAFQTSRMERRRMPKESALLRSERQLITWLVDKPEILDTVKAHVQDKDISDPAYQEVLRQLYAGIPAAQILDSFREDTEQYERVAAVFHGDLLSEDADEQSFRQALSDVVRNILLHAVDEKIRQETDGHRLQELFSEQSRLQALQLF